MNYSGAETVLVIGVGNIYRSDDGVGPMVARRLAKLNIKGLSVVEIFGDCTGLLEIWKECEKVVLVDAVSSGSAPGTIHRIAISRLASGNGLVGLSTHGFGVAEAVKLAQILGGLPVRLTLYGIDGQNFKTGIGLSPAVESAVGMVIERILEEAGCTRTH